MRSAWLHWIAASAKEQIIPYDAEDSFFLRRGTFHLWTGRNGAKTNSHMGMLSNWMTTVPAKKKKNPPSTIYTYWQFGAPFNHPIPQTESVIFTKGISERAKRLSTLPVVRLRSAGSVFGVLQGRRARTRSHVPTCPWSDALYYAKKSMDSTKEAAAAEQCARFADAKQNVEKITGAIVWMPMRPH